MEYIVVFENQGRENLAYAGIRICTSFQDKKKFEEWYQGEIRQRLRILAEAVSESEARELTRQTPRSALIAMAFERAVLSEKPFFIDELTLNIGLNSVRYGR